jgi:hemolysin III
VQGHLRAQTVGAIAYLLDSRLRYAHFVWHLFVLGGSACHFFAALWHAHGRYGKSGQVT